jgi:hypothetical protein
MLRMSFGGRGWTPAAAHRNRTGVRRSDAASRGATDVNRQLRSFRSQPFEHNPTAGREQPREEASPALMLSGIGSTALAMASFVWWNASSGSTPSLIAELTVGAVAALTLTLSQFICFQRWSRYAPHQQARALSPSHVEVRSEAPASRILTGHSTRHPRTTAANTRFRHAPTATRQRRRRTIAHASKTRLMASWRC